LHVWTAEWNCDDFEGAEFQLQSKTNVAASRAKSDTAFFPVRRGHILFLLIKASNPKNLGHWESWPKLLERMHRQQVALPDKQTPLALLVPFLVGEYAAIHLPTIRERILSSCKTHGGVVELAPFFVTSSADSAQGGDNGSHPCAVTCTDPTVEVLVRLAWYLEWTQMSIDWSGFWSEMYDVQKSTFRAKFQATSLWKAFWKNNVAGAKFVSQPFEVLGIRILPMVLVEEKVSEHKVVTNFVDVPQ